MQRLSDHNMNKFLFFYSKKILYSLVKYYTILHCSKARHLWKFGVTIEAQYGEVYGSSNQDNIVEDLTYQVWIFLLIFLTYQEAEV